MIREIINFVTDLERDYPEVFDLNKKPSPGLHLWVELDEEGNWKNNSPVEGKDYVVYDGKKNELSAIEKKSVLYEEVQDYLTMNKQQKFDMKQKIHSSSPFAISFNFSLNDTDKANNDIKKKPAKGEIEKNQKKTIDVKLDFVKKSLPDFFKNARNIILENDDKASNDLSDKFEKLQCQIIETISQLENQDGKNLLLGFKEKDYVRIYLKNVSIEEQRKLHEKYVSDNVFNKDDFNIISGDQTYGVADFMTTFASKKPFLSHQTSFFKKSVNTRITGNDALSLVKFEGLLNNKVLPNPILPIFVDKNEFKNNGEIVRIFNNEENGSLSYPQILKQIFNENAQRILANYYLLNLSKGRSWLVNDFDFVSKFEYFVSDCSIQNLFAIKNKEKEPLPNIKLHTIFGFENQVVKEIFNNSLVRIKDDAISYNYFNEVKSKFVNGGEDMVSLILQYRKAFYDFIYKSRKQAITSLMFDNLMLASILLDVKQDEGFKRDTQIKRKLNILFSLNQFFTNHNSIDMTTQFNDLMKKMDLIANDDNIQLDQNLPEFLFAAGQVIYYLLYHNKADKPSHAMLEPFLQKATVEHLQNSITNAVNTYKHEISFGKGRFERLCAQILAFKSNENIKNSQRYLLAGYFAPAVIFFKK